jgi:hypothetical protein
MSDEDLVTEAFRNGVEATGLYADFANPEDNSDEMESEE